MITATANYLAADAKTNKEPVFIITVEGYSRAFSNVSSVAGFGTATLVDWLVSIEDMQTTVNDLDGGADLADFIFSVQDRDALLTASFPTFVFEGKLVQLFGGYVGLDFADFVTFFTGRIDSVESSNSNLEYVFSCPDIRQDLNRSIYTLADDGGTTSSNHLRTVNGHPLDILIAALETECGLAPTSVDEAKIISYRDTIYSGAQMSFELDAAPIAKDFIENELMKPLGAYLRTDSLGRVTVEFAYTTSSATVFAFTPDNLLDIPAAGQADLINQVIVRLDATSGTSGGGFAAEKVYQSDVSISKYGMYGQQIIESKGLRSGLNGLFLARMTAFLLFSRYSSKALCHGDSGKSVSSDPVNALWSAALVEPGDFVTLTHPDVPDRENGVKGVTDKTYIVMDRNWQFPIGNSMGNVQFKLLQFNLGTFKQFFIAPDGEASYTSAGSTDQGKYMFLCDDSGVYSNSNPGNTLS